MNLSVFLFLCSILYFYDEHCKMNSPVREIKFYCIVLYCIVLYCIVLYCIVLYCIVLYCIVLYPFEYTDLNPWQSDTAILSNFYT